MRNIGIMGVGVLLACVASSFGGWTTLTGSDPSLWDDDVRRCDHYSFTFHCRMPPEYPF